MAFNGDCPCLATDTQRLPLRNHANGGGYGCKQCGQGIPRHHRSSNTLVAAKLCRRSRAETRVYAAGEERRDRWNAALPYANLLLSPSINVSGVTLFFSSAEGGEEKKDGTAERCFARRTRGGRRRFTQLGNSGTSVHLCKQALKLPVFISECFSAPGAQQTVKICSSPVLLGTRKNMFLPPRTRKRGRHC